MKKAILMCLSFLILLGISGCSYKDKEIEDLKKQNGVLQQQLKYAGIVAGKVDLKLSGDFTLSVHDIEIDFELGDKDYKTVVVSFFQSTPFLLRLNKSITSKLEVGKVYTFQFKQDIIKKGIENPVYRGGYITNEWILKECAEDIIFVGEAKENEKGLESDRIEVVIVQNN